MVKPASTTVATLLEIEFTLDVPPTVTVEADCAKLRCIPDNNATDVIIKPTNQFFKLGVRKVFFILLLLDTFFCNE